MPSRLGFRHPHRTHPVVRDFSTRLDLIEHERQAGATHVLAVGSGVALYYPMRGGGYEENRAWKQNGYWHGRAPTDRTVIDQLPAGAEPIESFLARSGRRAAEAPRSRHDGPTHLSIDGEMDATRIGVETSSTLNAVVETWKVHLRGDPSRPVLQVSLFRSPDGRWNSWTGQFSRAKDRELAERVAAARNASTSAGGHRVSDYIAVDTRGRQVFGPTKDYGEAKRWADQAGGVVKFETGRPPAMEAKRSGPARRTTKTAMQLAEELAKKVDGADVEAIPGGFRWSEPNESAQFTTYSPEYSQKVVVVVSVFKDGSAAVNFFTNEGLSDQYENISHFSYGPGGFTSRQVDVKQMVEDIEWVKQTVDGYAASWQQDQPEVDEPPTAREAHGDPHGRDRERRDLLDVLAQRGSVHPEMAAQLADRYQRLGVGPAELRRRLASGESPLEIAQMPRDTPRHRRRTTRR
jgi:hypothetical protein